MGIKWSSREFKVWKKGGLCERRCSRELKGNLKECIEFAEFMGNIKVTQIFWQIAEILQIGQDDKKHL